MKAMRAQKKSKIAERQPKNIRCSQLCSCSRVIADNDGSLWQHADVSSSHSSFPALTHTNPSPPPPTNRSPDRSRDRTPAILLHQSMLYLNLFAAWRRDTTNSFVCARQQKDPAHGWRVLTTKQTRAQRSLMLCVNKIVPRRWYCGKHATTAPPLNSLPACLFTLPYRQTTPHPNKKGLPRHARNEENKQKRKKPRKKQI